ncbi:MAG TPA: amidohydrolase family protein [Burkholderiales bacterium]|jgi:2-pyrone-4,6-dicarboxylate lactonase|nr:amidohydrolase family protein [Burkholderiales bacterium]
MRLSQEGNPDFKSPPAGCDCHFHVFGPAGRYPHNQADLRYAPPVAPVEDFLALARKLGIERFVFVQPSAYGRDNRCMLEAMRQVGTNCRGIVDIDENAPDAELERLDALGVRGVRINLSPIKPFETGFAPKLLPRIERLRARCAEIGWQLDFLTPGWLTAELMPTFAKLNLDFTLAHFGMFLAKDGVKQPGFAQLLELLRRGERHCWVKLTGVYRMSVADGFADVAPMARALIEAAPDRVIWGSDYPHLSFADKVGSMALWNLLGKWAPEEATRRKILVENPQRLFKF